MIAEIVIPFRREKLEHAVAATDLLIRNARVVRPGGASDSPDVTDIAVADGVVTEVGRGLAHAPGARVVEADGLLAFPGVVDAHQHWGIYRELGEDAESESRACAQGGVTTALSYLRTGRYYLDRGGSYRDFLPEVFERMRGRAHVDHGLHLAPMTAEHIDEIPRLVEEFGITSFKIFMFYGGHGLHGRSADQSEFLMIPPGERYDLAHFEFVMRGVQRARERFGPGISLSLHCETAEIMAAYTALVERDPELTGLRAYSASRPPHSEGLAITIASYLAHETGLPAINLLHLSSAKAVAAALTMAKAFGHIDFRREVTIGHLLADVDTAHGLGGKVNPPLRERADVEALWRHLLAGEIDWVVSDHACCRDEQKFGPDRADIFAAKSGFGGAEYLLPGLVGEGRRRGLPLPRIAELTSANPARRYGLATKGDIAPGYDADIALIDPDARWTVHAADSESAQEYTPFEGFEMSARVTDVFLRGHHILRGGKIDDAPHGRYLRRRAG
ncbi:dihydroorotase family protein [Nocardia sp. CDC159]|uniref:Dihydroorotase family protein n=1 Tax=Nocardia pulmonis TaxID=2951408 RepID=A0A9X2E0N0_9NOCA|nr:MULTISPECIES: dihydroorotase family protein [Nocardia]MCM6771944.1 dihydroorotase family protein [Nocardia pulmonis]MCM6785398.1 dihydroorotase family protein [Nocardia sp. CDC159]